MVVLFYEFKNEPSQDKPQVAEEELSTQSNPDCESLNSSRLSEDLHRIKTGFFDDASSIESSDVEAPLDFKSTQLKEKCAQEKKQVVDIIVNILSLLTLASGESKLETIIGS